MNGIYDTSGNLLLGIDGSTLSIGSSTGLSNVQIYAGSSTPAFNASGSTPDLTGYLKEASLGTSFVWAAGTLDVSVTGGGGVSQVYVDGSLASRDVQIASLNADVSTLNDNIGIQIIANGNSPVYVSSLDDLATYINSLTAPVVGVVVTMPPGNFSTSNPITFQSGMNILLKGSGLGFTLAFNDGVTFNSFTEMERVKITGDATFNAGIGLKDSLLTGNVTHTAGDFNVTKCGITGDYTNTGSGKIVALNLEQTGKMSLTGTGDQMLMNVQVTANDSSVAVYSAGQLIASNLVVSNSGGGDCVNCDNGAGSGAPNLLNSIYCFTGGITCGTAVTVIGSVYVNTSISGSAVSRLNTA